MSIKKTEIKLTIEQKQTWRVSQDEAETCGFSPVDNPALPEATEKMEIVSHEIRVNSRTWKVPPAFGKQIIRLVHFLKRLKKFVRRD